MRLIVRNILGSFADSAVLFPLLILLGASGQFTPSLLFASAGIAYVFSGLYFRIPMPVQPLKSITIAALAVGASAVEIRASAPMLGFVCVLMMFLRMDAWMDRVPMRVVHQIQLGLGVLLLLQAGRITGHADFNSILLVGVLAAAMLLLPDWRGIPWMGIFAAGGMVYVAVGSLYANGVSDLREGGASEGLRPTVVLALLLPQMALTFANSVLGTRAAARAYFPGHCERVTGKALLGSIGFGNIFMAAVGGLPFCHGSGGLTAHVRGGSTSWWSNLVIGSFLLALGAQAWIQGSTWIKIPMVLVASLLLVTGVQHFRLARETALQVSGRIRLAIAFILAATTQNLLWVFIGALCTEGIELWVRALSRQNVTYVVGVKK